MKKRTLVRSDSTDVVSGTMAYRTGDHCPVSGWWVPLDREAVAQFVSEGSIMPGESGMAVVWTLVKASTETTFRGLKCGDGA